MILDFCSRLRKDLDGKIDVQVDALLKGTGVLHEDERIRGRIDGLRIAQDVLQALEEYARKRGEE